MQIIVQPIATGIGAHDHPLPVEVIVLGDVLAAVIVGVPAFVSVYVKLALLDPLAIVNDTGANVTVPVELLDNVTVLLASVVFGLSNASCLCTVIVEEATPAVVVIADVVNTSLFAAPAI